MAASGVNTCKLINKAKFDLPLPISWTNSVSNSTLRTLIHFTWTHNHMSLAHRLSFSKRVLHLHLLFKQSKLTIVSTMLPDTTQNNTEWHINHLWTCHGCTSSNTSHHFHVCLFIYIGEKSGSRLNGNKWRSQRYKMYNIICLAAESMKLILTCRKFSDGVTESMACAAH